MADKPSPDIRGTLLAVISERQPKSPSDGSLQLLSVLPEAARRIGIARNVESEQGLLSGLHDLFRTGYLAWGTDIVNPSPPFFHVTESGRRLLAQLTRDPGNPAGYKAHLYSVATLNAVARSYIEE